MSFDFGGSLDSAPTDVPADVNVDPSSADYGSEQLTTDQAANPGDQVANQSGNSDFVNATDPSATQTAPETPSGYQNEASQLADGNGTATPSAIDGLKDSAASAVDKAKDAASGALDKVTSAADKLVANAESGVKNLGDQITAKASSTLTNLENQFTADNISKFATKTLNNVITTVEKTAVSLAVGVANKALSTVVGPAAASTLTNGAVNAFNAPPTKSATAVTPTTNPAVPSGYQNEAQQAADGNGDAPVSAKADPQAAQSDVAKLNADGSVDLSQFNKGPTQLPTNYTGEAVTLPADGNAVVSTSATDVNASVDPNSPNFVGPPNPGTLDKSAAPVADPNLATAPANPGAASINNTAGPVTGDPIAAFNTLNNLTGPTAAGLVNTALTTAAGTAQGLIRQAQNQQTARLQSNTPAQTGDWRVRLSLAPNSNYLYNATPDPGPVLWPLYNTNGVIFPYTPAIDTAYKANYSAYDLTHSNYRGYFYQNSYVDAINIKAIFTAQDTAEANYLLAVIHFFRSITKMFYGQDAQRGSPPPLVFLSGLGDYQFNNHPCVVSQFNYNLPADVNYIRAQNVLNNGTNQLSTRMRQTTLGNPISNAIQRLTSLGQGILPGAVSAPFAPQGSLPAGNPTYVPTKMDISLSLLPVQSRSQVSQQFSLAGFANGNQLKGGFW
jgi:F0F1-type ATP synthase membrane subunit b/b'